MNCAWCGSNADGSGSHGICTSCAALLLQQQADRHKEKAKEQSQGSEPPGSHWRGRSIVN